MKYILDTENKISLRKSQRDVFSILSTKHVSEMLRQIQALKLQICQSNEITVRVSVTCLITLDRFCVICISFNCMADPLFLRI